MNTMTRPVVFLILLHAVISMGGVYIHSVVHPVTKSLYFFLASPLSVFSLFVITILYCRPSTVPWGFMLNAGTIAAGTVGMSYYSLLDLEGPYTMSKIFLESTVPAIVILWIKLPVSYFILVKTRGLKQKKETRGCK